MSTFLESALDYLGRGWCVIPARGKKPLIKWEEYITKLPTEQQVRSWWEEWPSANIALVTGRVSNLVVVDVDPDRGGDPATVYEGWPTEFIARTGGGGAHLFYTYPEGVDRVPNQVGKTGYDVRADGGYIIAPPSIHPDTRRPYRFIREGETGKAPQWVVEGRKYGTDHDPDGETFEVKDDRWLSELLEGVESGGRNDACARLAGYFVKKDMPYEIALGLLSQWNDKNDPPLSASEISTTLSSVYRTHKRNYKGKKGEARRDRPPAEFELMDLDSFMIRFGSAAITWSVEDWMPSQTIAFVVSPPGSYKTWMILDLAVSIASGLPFLGHFPVKETGPVVVIQQEDFHGQLAERIASVTTSKFHLEFGKKESDDEFIADLPPKLPIHLHTERRLRFADEDIMESFAQRMRKLKPKLIIIDPLYSAGSTDDYMAKTAEQMFALKRLRDEIGCSFLIVHHTKKRKKDGKEDSSPDREDLWGSQFLNAFMESGWQVRRTDDKATVAVRRHFKVKGDVTMLQLAFDISTIPPYKYEVSCEELDMEDDDKKIDIIGILERIGASTPTDVAKAAGIHRSTVSRKMSRLAKEGVLKKDREGKYAVAEIPNF